MGNNNNSKNHHNELNNSISFTADSEMQEPEEDNPCKSTENHLSFQELKEFLFQARERELEIDHEAVQVIKKYFVASRRARNCFDTSTFNSPFGDQNTTMTSIKAGQGGHIPQSALKTLTTMAEAHAKLSLKSSVDLDDAILAIYLYE